ncbi:hypothetical protein [Corynebacterium aquatimens]|uniref:FMN phosphatase YigB (HAD superfamily) n=1 Tax=Corynebacterium aquatimens TaxID=1190508 RepID=A0A931GS33_9CORY|nr:hypothetical protein [Corynebacterium aquatimens]MBG6122623.1 FMN phosphatase YigB (HAD superfamily) [Corynebacterium aquatimens]WJY64837.1 hypothetical protein CAQUA_00445 [Corynebacterium aquatimens]
MTAFLFDLFGTLLPANPSAELAARQVMAHGHPCGVIATCPAATTSQVRTSFSLIAELDAAVFSSDIGVGLPDPRALRVAVDALGTRAERTIFFSTDSAHLAVAAGAGLNAVFYTGPEVIVANL